MPVVQPWYNPNFDIGQPAFRTFWNAYLGTRSEINDRIMRERLSTRDPRELTKLRNDLLDNISKLRSDQSKVIRSMGEMQRLTTKDQMDLVIKILDSMTRMNVANTTSNADIRVAALNNEGKLANTLLEYGVKERSAYEEGQGRTAASAIESINQAKRGGGDVSRIYSDYAKRAIATAKTDSEKLGILSSIWRNADEQGDQLGKDALLGLDLLSGFDPRAESFDAYVARTKQIVTPDQAKNIASELVDYVGVGGDPIVAISKFLQYTDIDPQVKQAVIEQAKRTQVQMGVQGPGAAPGQPARGPQVYQDYLDDLERSIKRMENELDQLKIEKAGARGKSAFSGFMANALTETLFQPTPMEYRPMEEAVGLLSAQEAKMATDLLEEAGGDPVRALELFKQRQAAPPPQPVPTPPESPAEVAPEVAPTEEPLAPTMAPETPAEPSVTSPPPSETTTPTIEVGKKETTTEEDTDKALVEVMSEGVKGARELIQQRKEKTAAKPGEGLISQAEEYANVQQELKEIDRKLSWYKPEYGPAVDLRNRKRELRKRLSELRPGIEGAKQASEAPIVLEKSPEELKKKLYEMDLVERVLEGTATEGDVSSTYVGQDLAKKYFDQRKKLLAIPDRNTAEYDDAERTLKTLEEPLRKFLEWRPAIIAALKEAESIEAS